MVQAGNSLYVGGDFTSANIIDAPRMIALDFNGKPKYGCNFGTGFNGEVKSIVETTNAIYVGGSFTQFRGQSANRIAKLKRPSCELDQTFSPADSNGFNGEVTALVVAASSLYAGGNFNSYRGVVDSANRIAKLDLNTGAIDTTFTPSGNDGFSSTIWAMTATTSSLYVGGEFSQYRYKGVANSTKSIAKLDLITGALDTTFSPPASNGFSYYNPDPCCVVSVVVASLVIEGSSLYVGGQFTNYRGIHNSAKGIAKLDLNTGTIDTNFSPSDNNGFDNYVRGIAVSGSRLFAIGGFNYYKGAYIRNIAKLDLTTGTLDTTFSQNGSSWFDVPPTTISASELSVFVGGAFTSYTTYNAETDEYVVNAANRIAKLDINSGAFDTAFSPPGANGFDSGVSTLTLSGTTLYGGGIFSFYKGTATSINRLAKIDLTSGSLDSAFSPTSDNGFNKTVNALAISGSSLYVGGNFTAYRGGLIQQNTLPS
jgi:hypothetical protein